MAKSLRSKTKRSFRRIKREESVFAVAHAARLERLSSKLADIKSQPPPQREEEEREGDEAGWYYSLLGLVDPDGIQADGWMKGGLLGVVLDELSVH